MAVGIIAGLIAKGYHLSELTFVNQHSLEQPVWPFMSAVSCTYILMAKEGFQISQIIAYPVGLAFAVLCSALYLYKAIKYKNKF